MMALSQKKRMTNDVYQDAGKKLIQFWKGNNDLVKQEKIRVKIMGQLDPEPLLPAEMRKHKCSKSRAEMKAMELCSFWGGQIGDVHI
uniref:Factor of DNA methylation 1-5/IDN2 domain-containing protein n=1 Tax=Noccaea caerulescens TaxID=107243 RepID=A0A1J3K986_NOCCA